MFIGSHIVVIPTRQNDYETSIVQIECYYLNSARCPVFSWRGPVINMTRDDGRPPRYAITEGNGISVLTISPLLEKDEGLYYCTCSTGESSGPSNVTVLRKSETVKIHRRKETSNPITLLGVKTSQTGGS